MWCYPESYKTKEAAGQMRDSPFRFKSVPRKSPTLLVTEGVAVLAGPTMPIIAGPDDEGGDGAEPNDTYIEQLVAAASAAVNQLVDRGIATPGSIAIGGHSYGAFTAANLLAHAGELFACGICRSGAYNRYGRERTHSLTHSLTRPLTHSLTRSPSHSPSQDADAIRVSIGTGGNALTRSLTRSLARSLAHSPSHSPSHSLAHARRSGRCGRRRACTRR